MHLHALNCTSVKQCSKVSVGELQDRKIQANIEVCRHYRKCCVRRAYTCNTKVLIK